jgi:hypothetical protein
MTRSGAPSTPRLVTMEDPCVGNEEDVRLHDDGRIENEVERGVPNATEASWVYPGAQCELQVERDELVRGRRGWAHRQLAIEDLVALSIVG